MTYKFKASPMSREDTSPESLIDDLRSRINPAYATQYGTESYERRVCAEALEALIKERDMLLNRHGACNVD